MGLRPMLKQSSLLRKHRQTPPGTAIPGPRFLFRQDFIAKQFHSQNFIAKRFHCADNFFLISVLMMKASPSPERLLLKRFRWRDDL